MNIDKDIERVKELQSTIYEGGDYIYLNKNDKQALGNVLKELETRTVQVSGQVQELETYKKIAEKLAEQIKRDTVFYDSKGISSCDLSEEKYCKCSKHNNGANCKQCIIDWARNEVANDKQS